MGPLGLSSSRLIALLQLDDLAVGADELLEGNWSKGEDGPLLSLLLLKRDMVNNLLA